MLALIALIAISLLVAAFFLVLFIKAVKNDQFKDTYTPAVRILFDDGVKKKTNQNLKGSNNE